MVLMRGWPNMGRPTSFLWRYSYLKSRRKQTIFCSIIPALLFWFSVLLTQYGQNTKTIVQSAENVSEVTVGVIPDEISIKYEEMLGTSVKIDTHNGSGSGTIINRVTTKKDGLFELRVLTNSHVVEQRFTSNLHVDSITGRVTKQITDTGCSITTFNHLDRTEKTYKTKIIKENTHLDLAILSFFSRERLSVAKIADDTLLSNIRIFNEVFVVGCQLGETPIPTSGIISRIITHENKEQEYTTYRHTAQIVGGSSGGGLFIAHNGHYYLIGIPFLTKGNWDNECFHIYPHLAESISILVAKQFIEESSVSK